MKMIKELIKLANELDERGLVKEAGILDKIIRMAAEEERDIDAEVSFEKWKFEQANPLDAIDSLGNEYRKFQEPESYESYDTDEAEMRREDEADHRSILDKSHAEAFEENISNEDVQNLYERLYDPDLHRPMNAEELAQLIEDMGLRVVPRHTAEMQTEDGSSRSISLNRGEGDWDSTKE